MILPACLVTSTPSYEEPERTPPFLLSIGARPDLRGIKVIDTKGQPSPVEFEALVRSEDNGARVFGRLVLDYGTAAPGGPPYPYQMALTEPTSIEPGTLSGPARSLLATWFITNKPTLGCHNVTMFATHEFAEGCAADPEDFDFLTWTILVCDSSLGSCCDPTAPVDQGGCTTFQCPVVDPTLVGCGPHSSTANVDQKARPDNQSAGAP